MLEKVKANLGITGTYQDTTIQGWIDEVKQFLIEGGVSRAVVNDETSIGVITIGVKDLWNYGSGDGSLSPYFIQRATQLAYKKLPTPDEPDSFYTKDEIDSMLNGIELKTTTFSYTSTEGQTTFSFNGEYDLIEVYVNHLKLNNQEFTVNNNSITLNDDLTAGQMVEVVLSLLEKGGA